MTGTVKSILCVAVASVWPTLSAQTRTKQALMWQASRSEWKDIPDVEGAQRRVVWGNPEKSAYGALEKLPGGTSVPLHWHTYDTRLVIVAGRLAVALEGKAAQELGPGSYCFLPGGLKHSKLCKPGADCLFFVMRSGLDDTKWISEKQAELREGERR